MSDVTFGVKMPEELKKQIEDLMRDAGLRTNKDFMQSLVNSYIVEKTKESIPEVAEDLKELQIITQRTNDIYLNMGYRIENINKVSEKENKDQLSKKDSIISDLQEKIEMLNFKNSELEELNENIVNQNSEQLKRVNELTEGNINIKELNEEYKSKVDTIAGLLKQYEKYPEQIEVTKQLLTDTNTKNNEFNIIIKEHDFTIDSLNKNLKTKENDISNLKLKNEEELKQVRKESQKELEQLKKENQLNIKVEVADVKEVLNDKFSLVQIKHNKEIEDYQSKYKSLLEEIERIRITPKSKKDSAAIKDK